MIGDYFPDDPKMRRMLRMAVNENIACRLLKVKDSDDAYLEIKKLKFYLHEEYGLDESIALQVVDCFAFALGLDSTDSHSQTFKSEIEPKQDRTIRKDAISTDLQPAEPEMVFVQGGTFMMGATHEQGSDIHKDEKPIHRVTVSDFYIGKYQVTQAQWKSVMGNNPSKFIGYDLPVELVSWEDVQDFISKLNTQTGKQYRLPTEAEWEFAARGGNRSKGYKYSGSNNDENVAWYSYNSGSGTKPVGTKSPNELDIYDMSGNVREWCSDWFGEYRSYTETNPQGSISGSYRVCRGGCWYDFEWSTRVSYRYYLIPNIRDNGLGFRLTHSSK